MADFASMNIADFFTKKSEVPVSTQMQNWGNAKSTSTLGEKKFTAEGAAKAQTVLNAIGSFIPGIGQAIAAQDYTKAMEEGDSTGGVLAAMQFLPVIGGTAKLGKSLIAPSQYALKQMRRGNSYEKGIAKSIKHAGTTSGSANATQFMMDWIQ